MAAEMNVDLGLTIIVGLAVAIPAALASWGYAWWIDRKLQIPIREAPGLSLEELEVIANRDESELPGFWKSLSPIILPGRPDYRQQRSPTRSSKEVSSPS